MLTTTVNFPTRRAPSPQIRTRGTSLNGASNVAPGLTAPPTWTPGLTAPSIWADSAVGIMRIAATAPIIENLPSIRLLLAQYLFDSLHDWHFEILFIVAIILHLVHILLQGL